MMHLLEHMLQLQRSLDFWSNIGHDSYDFDFDSLYDFDEWERQPEKTFHV